MTTDYETIAAASPPEAVIPSRRGGLAGRLVLAALALYCAWAIAGLFGRAAEIQDDFFVCYTAAKAQQAGISPYDTEALTRISGGRVVWPYFYSPLAAYAFRPLAALEMRTAARVWLGLKLLAVAALILIWRNVILGGKVDAFFYFFCALGFNATIYIDLAAGNISIFEQLALWTAFACLLRGRHDAGAWLIALVSLFKLTPIVFLGLGPLIHGRKAMGSVLRAGAAFAAVLGGMIWLTPTGRAFWERAMLRYSAGETGIIAPSTRALVQTLSDHAAGTWNVTVSAQVQSAIYLSVAAAVALVFMHAWWKMRRISDFKFQISDSAHTELGRSGTVGQAGSGDDTDYDGDYEKRTRMKEEQARILILLGCVTYTLLAPRMKDYAYILMLAPTYYVVRVFDYGRGLAILPILLLIYPANSVFDLPGLAGVYPLLTGYFPWFITLAVWMLYLRLIHGGAPATRR